MAAGAVVRAALDKADKAKPRPVHNRVLYQTIDAHGYTSPPQSPPSGTAALFAKFFEKIKKEAPYHALTNAGHISYIEMDGDPLKNLDAFEKVIRCMKEAGIGYGSVNHPVDRDPCCGFTGIIDDVCPGCGRHEGDGIRQTERIRRIICN